MPDFLLETHAQTQLGHKIIAGVDEVGRGPWAGPVMACAVVIDLTRLPPTVADRMHDSKKLTEKQRQSLYPELVQCVDYAIGQCSVAEIDQHNILQATMIAMTRAVQGLPHRPDYILVDGNRMPTPAIGWDYDGECVIKGDATSLSIAGASIIAKVTRDKLMAELAQQHPHYGWETNAGYGTKTHQQGLATHGITKHHRKSFAPIAKILGEK